MLIIRLLYVMKYTLKIIVFVILPFLSSGQTNVFEWGEGLTYYTGKFDTTKYSLKEIENIYNYLHTPSSEMLTIGNVWKIEQMDTATTTPIDNYYKNTLHILETMHIPEGEYWDSLLMLRKRELYEVCNYNKLFILAIKDPKILFQHYHQECANEIKALNCDSTSLLNAWFELKERQKLNNCCPENVEKKYLSKFNSNNRLKHAKLELMIYGWGNCMNQFVYHHTDYARIEEEFQKLFISVDREDEED